MEETPTKLFCLLKVMPDLKTRVGLQTWQALKRLSVVTGISESHSDGQFDIRGSVTSQNSSFDNLSSIYYIFFKLV